MDFHKKVWGYFHKKMWGLVLISILITVYAWTCRTLDSGVLADTVYRRPFRLCMMTSSFASPVCMLLVTLTQFQGSSNIKTGGIAASCIFQRSLYLIKMNLFMIIRYIIIALVWVPAPFGKSVNADCQWTPEGKEEWSHTCIHFLLCSKAKNGLCSAYSKNFVCCCLTRHCLARSLNFAP